MTMITHDYRSPHQSRLSRPFARNEASLSYLMLAPFYATEVWLSGWIIALDGSFEVILSII